MARYISAVGRLKGRMSCHCHLLSVGKRSNTLDRVCLTNNNVCDTAITQNKEYGKA